jgi:hypothetical protein
MIPVIKRIAVSRVAVADAGEKEIIADIEEDIATAPTPEAFQNAASCIIVRAATDRRGRRIIEAALTNSQKANKKDRPG